MAKLLAERATLSDYRWLHLLLALPISIVIHIFVKVVQLTSKHGDVAKVLSNLPSNAIVFGFHTDLFSMLVSATVLSAHNRRTTNSVGIAYHGLFSYFPSVTFVAAGLRIYRFQYGLEVKPFVQIVRFMKEHPECQIAIYPDAGRSYGRVRESLVALARETQRPLIGTRFFHEPHWLVGTIRVPRPFGRMSVRTTSPIDVGSHEPSEALHRIQSEMDALATSR